MYLRQKIICGILDIYIKQAMFDTREVEESVDFECLLCQERVEEGALHPHELIFGKTGFSIIQKLLKDKNSLGLLEGNSD